MRKIRNIIQNTLTDFIFLSIGNLSVIGTLVYLLHISEGKSKILLSGHWGFISFIAYATYGIYVRNMQFKSTKLNLFSYFFAKAKIRKELMNILIILTLFSTMIIFYSRKAEILKILIDLFASICIISMNHYVGNYHHRFGFRKANYLLVSISVGRFILALIAANFSSNIVFILFCSHSAMAIGALIAKKKVGQVTKIEPEGNVSLLKANFLIMFFWVIFFSDILFKNVTLFSSDAILLTLLFKSLFTFFLFPLISASNRNESEENESIFSARATRSYLLILLLASIISVFFNKPIFLLLYNSKYEASMSILLLLASGNFLYAYLLYSFLINLRTFKIANFMIAIAIFLLFQMIIRNIEEQYISVVLHSLLIPVVIRFILKLELTKFTFYRRRN